jgi:CheY-like chemotaxis protein
MRRILLVEDNDSSRDMLTRRLRKHNFEVTTAINGQEALDLVRKDAPDVVLLDMSLPVMDGWTAVRELRADAGIRHVPVIALTAHAGDEERKRAIEAGCDDYETKPVDMPRLLSTIEHWLEAGRR